MFNDSLENPEWIADMQIEESALYIKFPKIEIFLKGVHLFGQFT